MDAAVGDEPLDGLLGDLAPVRIEPRQDDRPRRVVDDQVDAGGDFQGADVAALAADDAPLEVVARQVDHRHRRLGGVLGGAALDGFGDELPGALGGRFPGFGVEPLHQVRRVPAGVGLHLLDERVPGLVGRQARDPLQLALLIGHEALVLGGRLRRGLLALGERLLLGAQLLVALLDGAQPLGQLLVAARQRLLEGVQLLPPLARLALGVDEHLVGALLRLEQRLLLLGFRVPLGVLRKAGSQFLGPADGLPGESLAVGDPDEEHGRTDAGRDEGVHDVNHVGSCHAASSRRAGIRPGPREHQPAGVDSQGAEGGERRPDRPPGKGPALPCGEVDEPAKRRWNRFMSRASGFLDSEACTPHGIAAPLT